jgi:hypothetical protein
MCGALKKSLAAWREEHGFGLLCTMSPEGERFVVVHSALEPSHAPHGDLISRCMSQEDLRTHLAETGLSDPEFDEAVQLAREWATTVSGSSVSP